MKVNALKISEFSPNISLDSSSMLEQARYGTKAKYLKEVSHYPLFLLVVRESQCFPQCPIPTPSFICHDKAIPYLIMHANIGNHPAHLFVLVDRAEGAGSKASSSEISSSDIS